MKYFFKSISVLIILFCSSFLSYSHANVFVTVDDFAGNGWLFGHYSWISQEAEKDTVTCHLSSGCNVTICALGRTDAGGLIQCNVNDALAPHVFVPYGATAGEMHQAYTSKNGVTAPYKTSIFGYINTGAGCVGMIYISKTGVGQPQLIPGGNCTSAIKPQECEIGVLENIQYGTLLASELSGSRASGSINILCTLTSNVKISMSDTEVQLGTPNLVAKLSAGGKNLANGKTLKITRNQNTQVSIESVLQKKGPLTSGDYSGSAVITISYD